MFINDEVYSILQVILFSIPVLTLMGIGLVILSRSIAIVNRKWHLSVFLPLVIANLVAIFDNESFGPGALAIDWQSWLILGVDLILVVVGALTLRGYAIYGLTQEQVEQSLNKALTDAGFTATSAQGEWKSGLGMTSEAVVITWKEGEQSRSCWITSRTGEVTIHTKSRGDYQQLSDFIDEIRHVKNPYQFNQHAVGILYLVIAVVLAAFGWIYFFEPRLVLIE